MRKLSEYQISRDLGQALTKRLVSGCSRSCRADCARCRGTRAGRRRRRTRAGSGGPIGGSDRAQRWCPGTARISSRCKEAHCEQMEHPGLARTRGVGARYSLCLLRRRFFASSTNSWHQALLGTHHQRRQNRYPRKHRQVLHVLQCEQRSQGAKGVASVKVLLA